MSVIGRSRSTSPDSTRWYLYRPDSDHYQGVTLPRKAHDQALNLHYESPHVVSSWKPLRLKPLDDGPQRQADFPCLVNCYLIPIVSPRAWAALKPLLGDACEALRVIVRPGRPYYLINVPETTDCIHEDKSELSRNGVTGAVSAIYRYAFHADRMVGKHIIKTPLRSGADLLVDDVFRQTVESNGLRGLMFLDLPLVGKPDRRLIRSSEAIPRGPIMPPTVPADSVVVSDTSFRDEEPFAIIESNVGFLNALFDAHVRPHEVAADGLRSYYVDYYRAKVYYGGFAQFVSASGWDPRVVQYVRDGLQAMKATRNLRVLEEGERLVQQLGRRRLRAYLDSGCCGASPWRDNLSQVDGRLRRATKHEDLFEINAAWLRKLPNLVVMTTAEMREEVCRRSHAIPDPDKRIVEAWAKEPRYMKLIRALCARAGYAFIRITGGDLLHTHRGVLSPAFYFLTDHGPFHMIESGKKAILFRGESTTDKVCEVKISTVGDFQ